MAARGEIDIGRRLVARSLIDSEYEVEIVSHTMVGDRPAVIPRISGRGWIFGSRTVSVDSTDPYPLGFVVSDLWGAELNREPETDKP